MKLVMLGLGTFILVQLTAATVSASEPMAGMGIMAGEVTATSAYVQVRLTQTDSLVNRDVPGESGVVEFTLSAMGSASESATPQLVEATAAHDFIARAVFQNLAPGTAYQCSTRIGSSAKSLRAGPVSRFKTHPGADSAAPVQFVVVTGMNYAKFHGDDRIDRKQHLVENNSNLPEPYAGPDKHLGYPALEAILSMKPDFFVGTGDNVYYDTPDNPRAETVPQLRQKWHEQFVQPRYVNLFAAVPTFWEIDDHDYRIDDGDNTGDHDPSPEVARKMVLEQLPVAAHDDHDAKTFRTHRVSHDLQLWFVENRMYRSPNLMEDGPEKSIWGQQQRAWLMQTLLDSDATFKVLISPTPMIGPDDIRKTDNHTNHGGFRHERTVFFRWLEENGLNQQNFFIVCGDRHWQYRSVDPSGIEEFASGALIDANSRPGRQPGDPLSTDPDALIKQPYQQTTPSGGFLLVTSVPAVPAGEQPAQLTFDHYDEHGQLLNRTVKSRP